MNINATIINVIFRLLGSRRMRPSAIRNPSRTSTTHKMKKALKNLPSKEVEILGHAMITFSTPEPASNLHIIYLHGGAYVWQGELFHLTFIKKLMLEQNCRATYIDYPLAPEHTYIDTFEMLQSGFDHITRSYPDDKFILMGDSAGGGLALAFAQKLKKENHSVQPEKLILLSPWLDLELDNPRIKEVEQFDHILSVGSLTIAGDLYAGGDDKSEFLLSPINGPLTGVGEIYIFIGTRDILWPDCQKLKNKAQEIGESLSLFEYIEMPHTFMLFPIPSAKDVFYKIMKVLNDS